MDECSDTVILAVFLVADILIAVVDREIEVPSAAPKVVELRDGCPSIVGEFRRVGVVQPFHFFVHVEKLIANSNELVLQVFALFDGEVALSHCRRRKTTLGLL